MKDPEDQSEQKSSSNEPHSGSSPEQTKHEREATRKEDEPADVGQAAEESKRDTNA
ncbi:MAG TPA: hypothetical protein VGD78_18410 [Chthoniobacterales bacterium]